MKKTKNNIIAYSVETLSHVIRHYPDRESMPDEYIQFVIEDKDWGEFIAQIHKHYQPKTN